MKLSKIYNHYQEEINYDIAWDIMIFNKNNPDNKIILKEDSTRFWGADPFLFETNGILYLFYERYDKKKRKGDIVYRQVNKDFSLGKVYIAIEEKYHLSFPFIFEYNGNFFIIPESSSKNNIQIYKAEKFPEKWLLYKEILPNFPGLDTIILSLDMNNIVLYTSVGDSCNVENYVLTLDSDFNLKKKEKIKSLSSYGNRNAGRIINDGKNIVRVGQDCSNGNYGKGLIFYDAKNIKKEIEISNKWFRDDILPNNKKYCGIHTYNECNDNAVIDMKYLKKKSFSKKFTFFLTKSITYINRRLINQTKR